MDIEQTLRMAFVPREPTTDFEEAVMARVSAAAWRASHGSRRKPGRVILFSTILAIVAAAAMLASWLMNPQPAAEADQTAAPVPEPINTTVVDDAPASVEPKTATNEEKVEPKEVVRPVKPFTVRVMLRNEATDAARSAVDSFYASVLERLRAVPGLTLIESDPAGAAPDAVADYQLTFGGKGPLQGNQFTANFEAQTKGPDGQMHSRMNAAMLGEIAPACAGTVSEELSCSDPIGRAASMVRMLRTMFLPPDPSLRQQLLAQLRDRNRNPRLRLAALKDLGTSSAAPGDLDVHALGDPAVVRDAISLAATATDPAVRAGLWRTMRDVHDADLRQALMTASRQDPDGDVRMEAVVSLAQDLADDPSVRATLEAAAREDARPLVRALAQRALDGASGAAAWREYILSSLKDASRPPIERIEALFYHLNLPIGTVLGFTGGSSGSQGVLRHLGSDGIQALMEILPKVAMDSSNASVSAMTLVSELGQVESPAITDMLLASLDGSQWLDRYAAVRTLGASASRRNDPRVQAVLEKISTSDKDPQLRQIAAESLGRPVNPVVAGAAVDEADTDAEQPPRLGVSLDAMQSGPSVPAELVGKGFISYVAPDSVAQKAGLMEGDVLLEINNVQIPPSYAGMLKLLDTMPRGVDVDVLVYRSGQMLTLKARF